jgi:hypothetical protein
MAFYCERSNKMWLARAAREPLPTDPRSTAAAPGYAAGAPSLSLTSERTVASIFGVGLDWGRVGAEYSKIPAFVEPLPRRSPKQRSDRVRAGDLRSRLPQAAVGRSQPTPCCTCTRQPRSRAQVRSIASPFAIARGSSCCPIRVNGEPAFGDELSPVRPT